MRRERRTGRAVMGRKRAAAVVVRGIERRVGCK